MLLRSRWLSPARMGGQYVLAADVSARHVADAAPAIVRLVAFLGRDVPAA